LADASSREAEDEERQRAAQLEAQQRQRKDKWRWHKFAVVDGEEDLVQVKETLGRRRLRRPGKPSVSRSGAPAK
jgi:hypothetical protein